MRDLILVPAACVLVVISVMATLPCAYLLLLTVLSGRPAARGASTRRLRFDVIVPAHNEAAGITRTVKNLLKLAWPKNQFRVLVVADNCTDETAEVARAAGADVLVRTDTEKRGKGYALAFAFNQSRLDANSDAVVIVDADSEASPNLLEAFAIRIEDGAVAVQAHYGVLNASASWRTRLMAIALGSFHKLRSRGRERLGVSCGIRGNGWGVTHALLGSLPYQAFSLTEDIEFGIELGLAGHRVEYVDEASVDGEMVTGAEAAKSQRQRWESGRFALIAAKLPALLRTAVKRPSATCLDLAADLLVMPLSYLVLTICALIVLGILAWYLLGLAVFLWVGTVDIAIIVLYVLRGWRLSEVGARGLWDLARAPAFIIWKVMLMLSGRANRQWVRTDREAQ